jgi:hypothetical protein
MRTASTAAKLALDRAGARRLRAVGARRARDTPDTPAGFSGESVSLGLGCEQQWPARRRDPPYERHTPVQVQNLSGVVTAIAGGGAHGLALKHGLSLDNGQLGDGTTTYRYTPVQVQNLSGVKSIAGGNLHSLALKNDGTLWAWGANDKDQLGDGTTIERHTPVQVQNLSGVTAIAGGYSHSLALKDDGTLWAWGWNLWGQLGDATTQDRSTPVRVQNLSGVFAIAAGGAHSLALKGNGLVSCFTLPSCTVWGWGENSSGQLGDGTPTTAARQRRFWQSDRGRLCG